MNDYLSLSETCFILAHYTKWTIKEKWCFLNELYSEDPIFQDTFRQYEKLSEKKKASFFEFKSKFDVHKQLQYLSSYDVSYVSIDDPSYPFMLREIFLPPLVLFYKGSYDWLSSNIVGIVGARECTVYGQKSVDTLVPELVKQGITISSGLARGIDTKAHEASIRASGQTIAVIGTGLDRYYPRENQRLQRKIEKEQLILSEFPLGTRPLKHHFPLRNRIISGISSGVVVIEAKKRSGSLITAYQALEQNRDVYAVPGSIFEERSAGTNELIKIGAKLITSANDIIEDLNF
ncbi:DNA-processing protein DprA [Marinilactibacillus sp. GCM10026970]|uniref:DNA-processing protein DprA n=1 Tax=Marinilactibacillus sp. GCM10026970 TaxID=3252642 RepID=UPI00360BD514